MTKVAPCAPALMSGRLSRKRWAPSSPEAAPATLDITDDFSDEPVTFRAPKKPRTVARDRSSKASSESLRRSSTRNTSSKSSLASQADTTDKEIVSTEKNSSTKNTGKRKEVIVLTLDDDDDDNVETEKQEDESDDSKSPFPTFNSIERARSCLSSRVKTRKTPDAAALARTQGKSSSLGGTSAATTSSYFSTPAAGSKIYLSNRLPRKFYEGGAQDASYTAPDRKRYKTTNQHVRSLDTHNKQEASDPNARNELSVNTEENEGLYSAADTKGPRDIVGSEDGSNTAADNESFHTKSVDIKEKIVGAADTIEEQVFDSDSDDPPSVEPRVRQRRLVATVPDDDEEEEEYNLDTLPVDPFLAELEKSVCSEHEKLCPSCKHIVPAVGYGSHLRLCFGKYQYSHAGQRRTGEEGLAESKRRGRSAALNQIEKSTVEGQSSAGNSEAECFGRQTLTSADVCDDFKEQGNKINADFSTNDRIKVKASRGGRTKSRSRLDSREEKEQQQEPKEGRQLSKEDRSHDGLMEVQQKTNKLDQQSDKKKIRQEGQVGDRLPSSGGGDVVKSRQPLLSVSAGVLQVVQRVETTACVLDPAAALTSEPSCMVRIKRGRGLASSASGALPLGPEAARSRRGRGKKGLQVTSFVSSEQRSVALAERLAAVLLSGKPDAAEPWESVTRGRSTAVGVRFSGAVTRVISEDQPLWQLCRSDRGDIQQYYVPELAPHVVPPTRDDSLNITMHRHLSQIPGRLNITQSLGLPGGAFSDEDEEPYGQEDHSSSFLYGPLGTTQLALARLLGSQADEILNWSLRSTFDAGGESGPWGTRSQEEGQGTQSCKKSMGEGLDRSGEHDKRDGNDGDDCDAVKERDAPHRSDRSGEEIEGRRSKSLTNRSGNISGLCEGEVEIGSDTKMNLAKIQSHMAGNEPISCNDVFPLTVVNSSPKCAVTKKRECPANTSSNEHPIPDKVDVGYWPETGVSFPVAVAKQDVAGKDFLPPRNKKIDGKADLIKTTLVAENTFGDQHSVLSATRKEDGSGRVTWAGKDDDAEQIVPVDASAVISEAVLQIAHMQHASDGVQCIKTSRVSIPAIEAVTALELTVPSDIWKFKEEKDKFKSTMPSLLMEQTITSSTTSKEIRVTALDAEPVSKGGSDCSDERDSKRESVTEEGVGGEGDGLVWQNVASAKSFRSRDDASDVTILFDASTDAEVTGRQEKPNDSSGIVSRERKNIDEIEAPGKTETKVGRTKEGSPAKTIIFEMHENGSKAVNPSDDNRQQSTIPHSCDKHSKNYVSLDVILLDDGSSTKSLPIKNREGVNHVLQASDCSPKTKDTRSANKGHDKLRAVDFNAHEREPGLFDGASTRDVIGEPPGLGESVPRLCTTIPASDSSVSGDGTDQMFSKTKAIDIRKKVTCSKRTLSNLSVKNLSLFNSLQAACSSNPNPMRQSSDYMLERYLSTMVRDVCTPAGPTSPSDEDREPAPSSGVEAVVAESLSSIQDTMLTSMVAAWRGLLDTGDGGDVTVYTMESSFDVHAFVLKVRCPSLLTEAHYKVQTGSIKGRICSGEVSSETPCLLWNNLSHEASRHFFSYIYGGCCDWKSDETAVVREVLSLALKYKREDLVQYCQATAMLRKTRQQTTNSLAQTHDGFSEKNTRLNVSCDDKLRKSSSFRCQTTPKNVTPVHVDKLTDRAVRRSLTFSPSSPADHDISLPSLDCRRKNISGSTEKSKITPILSPNRHINRVSTSKEFHPDEACHSTTADKISKPHVPTPIDISKLLEGRLCGMSGSVFQTACTNRSLDKQSNHYKSSATVRSVSPDLFSDSDEDHREQTVHSQERNRNHVDQSLISDGRNLHHSDHSKILQNLSDHSARSNKIFPDSDVRLRLSSVEKTNSTVKDDAGNENNRRANDSVELNEASHLCYIGLESNPKSPSKTDDQKDSRNRNKINNISTSVVHGEGNVIDISQSDSDTNSQSSTPTLTSLHLPPDASSPLSPSKVGANTSGGKPTTNSHSITTELYNKTTYGESETGQTSNACVSNVWDDFEDMGYCQDDGVPLASELTSERPTCDFENHAQTESRTASEHLKIQTKISDDRPKVSECKSYGLNSTVVEAAKNKFLNLSSACQNISKISQCEVALQRLSEGFRGAVTPRHTAHDSYSSAKIDHSSINSHIDTGDLHSNSLVRKMFSNDTLMQLQDELQKEWDGEELELSTGVNDTSLRSRLTNKRKLSNDLCAQESPKHKRKCRTPSKRKADAKGHPSTNSLQSGTNHLLTNRNRLQNVTKRQRDIFTSEVPSNDGDDDQLPNVEGSPAVKSAAGGVSALPHRVQQLQGRRAPITSSSTPPFSPNCSAADSSLAITPKPDFFTMPTPDLKRRLQQFGIRPLSRNKARALLQHIYEQTHPIVSSSRPSGAGSSDRLQSPVGGIVSCQSGHNVAALRTSTPVGRSRAGAARRAADSEKGSSKRAQALSPQRTTATAAMAGSAQSVAPRAKSGDQKLEESDCVDRLGAHEAHAADISSTSTTELVDLSQSDGEEDSGPGCAEESLLLQLPDEEPAAVADIESVHEQLRALIVSDSSLHRAVLLYQPIWLHHFKDAAAYAGIRCTAAALVDFLDQQCITFRMGSSAGAGRTRTRLKKSRKKRGGVA